MFKTEFGDLVKSTLKMKYLVLMEQALISKCFPKKSCALKTETLVSEHKLSKERIIILAYSNNLATFQLPLLCIGKSKNPRALKSINPSSLPVLYWSHKSAWMLAGLFTEWFYVVFLAQKCEQFLENKSLHKKGILMIDNLCTHLSNLKSGEIEVMFFPSNVTSLVQLMNQVSLDVWKETTIDYYFVHFYWNLIRMTHWKKHWRIST